MPSLKSDLIRRVERLPKPTRTGEALLPLFEAISNSIHSVQARFRTHAGEKGRIDVTVTKPKSRKPLTITISDNGVGLDEQNFLAFSTTDTDNKITIGGKGVGRLLWLDCFELIHVESAYKHGSEIRRRAFDFGLANEDQISSYSDRAAPAKSLETGMTVKFSGLRDNGYRKAFPERLGHIFRHVISHFLPTFIGGKSPEVVITCEDESHSYPQEIDAYIHRKEEVISKSADEFGSFKIVMMECDKVASADLQGRNFIHFIAHDRTVLSQCIDGKLGLKYFGDSEDRSFHACLFGEFLDKNVNQERTAFTFPDATINILVNDVCMPHVAKFLQKVIAEQRDEQGRIVKEIVDSYPSLGFGSVPELQGYVPLGELKRDAIFGHLSQQRYRRDQKQAEKIRNVLSRLKGGKIDSESFSVAVAEASRALEETGQRSLAEYVVRRKVVLDFMELLVEKVKAGIADAAYQREDVLHSFVCPMQVNAVAEGELSVLPASHELWVIDERLTFAQYFSSDVSFEEMAHAYGSADRPDIIVFDRVHGLRQGEGLSKVLVVEFKRPGRANYDNDENPQFQIQRYIKRLLSNAERDVRGRPIRLSSNTVFHCFVVADCLGRMDEWTESWARTADGRGRIYTLEGAYRGSIELIEWDTLIKDARDRNRAFFDRVGIAGTSIFSAE